MFPFVVARPHESRGTPQARYIKDDLNVSVIYLQ